MAASETPGDRHCRDAAKDRAGVTTSQDAARSRPGRAGRAWMAHPGRRLAACLACRRTVNVSGFVFDAKAVRAAIAARSIGSADAAVVAVVAVLEPPAVRQPQEPQQPQVGAKLRNTPAPLSRAEEPQEPQQPQGGQKLVAESFSQTDVDRESIVLTASSGMAAVSAVLAVEGGAVVTEAEGQS